MGNVIRHSSTVPYKSVDIKFHPRKTLAHHLKECRQDPFPAETEHSITWKLVELGASHIRCYLTGCDVCDSSKVFLEKVIDNDGNVRLALRRAISATKTISLKFRGLEDCDLSNEVNGQTLTRSLMSDVHSLGSVEYYEENDSQYYAPCDFVCAMNFILSLSEGDVTSRLSN